MTQSVAPNDSALLFLYRLDCTDQTVAQKAWSFQTHMTVTSVEKNQDAPRLPQTVQNLQHGSERRQNKFHFISFSLGIGLLAELTHFNKILSKNIIRCSEINKDFLADIFIMSECAKLFLSV